MLGMLGNLRNLLWIIPLGLLFTAPIWQQHAAKFLTPRGGYDAAAERAYTEASREFVMDKVVLTFSNKGVHTWTIHTRRSRTGKTDRDIKMVEVNAAYNKKGDDPINITSKKGRYNMDEKHLTLIDDVVILKPIQQEELHTDLLHFYDKTDMLISPGPVQIKSPKFDLRAGMMEYNIATKQYSFSKRVDVTL